MIRWPFATKSKPNGVDAAFDEVMRDAEDHNERAYALRDDLRELKELMRSERQRGNGAAKPEPVPADKTS